MKAFIMPDGKTVQIGDMVYDTISGHVQQSQANRTGLAEEAIRIVYVPGKSLQFAKAAVEQGSHRKR